MAIMKEAKHKYTFQADGMANSFRRGPMASNRINEVGEYSMQFDSLTKALEGLFDRSLNELPDALRDFIKSKVLLELTKITSWDKLLPDDRRLAAELWDSLQKPAAKRDNEYWENFTQRKEKIKAEITKWEIVTTPTASDLEKKETRLDDLRRQLALLEHKQENARVDHLFQDDLKPESSLVSGNPDYISFPKAHKLLAGRLSATPAEIAAWIHIGPFEGGLAAYIDVNELTSPKRFHFDYCKGDDNYLSHLMGCWFLAKDIMNFQPEDRFVTGQQLIEYWGKQPDIQVDAFIRVKISEGHLHDYQPVMEGGYRDKNEIYLPIETALFSWSDVELVDIRDFGSNPFDINKLNSNHYPANILPYVLEILRTCVEDNLPFLQSSTLTQDSQSSDRAKLVNNNLIELEKLQAFISNLNDCPTNDEIEKRRIVTNLKLPFSAMKIKLHFVVINTDEDENHKWWTDKMRNASDNGLTECRVGKGMTGRVGSLWRPDLIADWLVGRHERNVKGMSKNSARATLKKFSGYEDTADELFPRDD